MINDSLSLDVGDNIKFNGAKFIVDGYIVFKDDDGGKWTEYKIRSNKKPKILWLSVDKLNNEYAVYSEEPYSEKFLEENIKSNGYKKVDDNSAKVVDYRGNVDVDLGEKVLYKEYEDSTEELLISIEDWDGECEFSKGYYIDKNHIEKLDFESNNMYKSSILYETKYETNKRDKHRKDKISVAIILPIILIIIAILVYLISNIQNKSLSKFIKSNSNFQYETSITSDLDVKRKADVYSTNTTIEGAARLIIEGLQGKIEDVQENNEDGTVAIMTTDEMALIYLDENSKTLIQVSLREYVYSSRSGLYRGRASTNRYYRSYYYNRGYSKDRKRYSDLTNGYSDYGDSTFVPNDNNKYKTYSDSIRQSSVNSRSSSGGGVSFGK